MADRTRLRPFSLRHAKALSSGTIQVFLGEQLRRRLWSTLVDCNEPVYYSEPHNPNWMINSSVMEESEPTLCRLLGIDLYDGDRRVPTNLNTLVMTGEPAHVFDLLEVFHAESPTDSRVLLQRALNDAFVDFVCPWRLSDGMLFRVDSEFLEQEVMERAMGLLNVSQFEGAREEFKTARDHLTDGATRDAIVYAAHSVESTLKAITGAVSGVAGDLLRQFADDGFMDDLPAAKTRAVAKALGCAAILRNELGGHGQGATVLDVPRPYAELAVHLAAAINHFVIAQHLRKTPPVPELAAEGTANELTDEDIPF